VLTAAYWSIGRRLVEYEQGGKGPAAYGSELLKRLSRDLQTSKAASSRHRFATRYEKNKPNFHALVALACSRLHLQLYVDTA
jgi:hypothetical protein